MVQIHSKYSFYPLFRFIVLFALSAPTLNAYDFEFNLNLSGNSWTPDHIEREKKFQQYPFPTGEASDLSKKGSGNLMTSFLFTNEAKTNSFYGSYFTTSMNSMYTTQALFSMSLFKNEFHPAYSRWDGRLGWIYNVVPGAFGIGLGVRKIDTSVDESFFNSWTLEQRDRRELFLSEGPEINLHFGVGESDPAVDISLSLFSLGGPYRMNSIYTFYSQDIFNPDLAHRTIVLSNSISTARTTREGGELGIQLKKEINSLLHFNVGVIYNQSNVSVKGYQTNNMYLFSDPLLKDAMNDPALALILYSIDLIYDTALMRPFYKKKFSDRFASVYFGMGVTL